MQDEFDCNVEDDSEEAVAGDILAARRRVEEGDLGVLRELEERWRGRGQIKANIRVEERVEEVDEEEWDGFDEDGDVDMDVAEDGAPNLVPVRKEKERVEPEVDEEGFTKVVGKKKR